MIEAWMQAFRTPLGDGGVKVRRSQTAAMRDGWHWGGMAALGLVLAAVGVQSAIGVDPPVAWKPLFDGMELGAWKPTPFGGEGDVTIVDGALRIQAGATLSGVTWGGEFPRQGYEIALRARRVEGDDFFCGLTFPVGDDACTLVLGGWGGGVVGLSCIDGADASENDTTQYQEFERGRWYDVVVRVMPERIECLLDGKSIIDQPITDKRISVRLEVELSKPLGIATYATTGEIGDIRWRPLARPGDEPGPDR